MKKIITLVLSVFMLAIACIGCTAQTSAESSSKGSETDIIVGRWVAYGSWATVDDGGDSKVHPLDASLGAAPIVIFTANSTFSYTNYDGSIINGTYSKTTSEDLADFNFSEEYINTYFSSSYTLKFPENVIRFISLNQEKDGLDYGEGDHSLVFKRAD
ncbi:MAG: hypothetical protein LBS74_09280 [Oscillospiraceae bacterium]|jgi:hypothetical protein|nr:hypothetical protein [Oscillospiraceae bacterium]